MSEVGEWGGEEEEKREVVAGQTLYSLARETKEEGGSC